MIIVITYKENT